MKTPKLMVVLFAPLAITAGLAACGNDPIPGPGGPVDSDVMMDCTMTDATTTIGGNHPHGPHSLAVTKEDVAAGADKNYDLMGQAVHTHQITITSSQFMSMVQAGMIMTTSTEDVPPTQPPHTHVVTISCK